MPLDPSKKLYTLRKMGYDPAEYDLDEEFNVVPLVKEQPAVAATSAPIKPSYGKAETFGRNAALGVAPSVAGAAGWAGGTALAAALAPETFGASLLIPLAASLLSSGVAGYAQNKALEQSDAGKEFLTKTGEASAENPTTALLGGLAPNLGLMRPSLSVLKDAGKAVSGSTITGLPRAISDNPNAMNVALGTALGAGQGIYSQMRSDEPFSPLDLGIDVAAGALMNQPWKHPVNRALGMHPSGRTGMDREGGTVATLPEPPKPSRFAVGPDGTVIDRAGNPIDAAEAAASQVDGVPQRRANDFVNAKAEELLQEGGIPHNVDRPSNIPKPRAITELGEELHNDYSGVTEHDNSVSAAESARDLELRRLEAQLGNEERPRYQPKEQKATQGELPLEEDTATWLANREKAIQGEERTLEVIRAEKAKQDARIARIKEAKALLRQNQSELSNGAELSDTLPEAPASKLVRQGEPENLLQRAQRLAPEHGMTLEATAAGETPNYRPSTRTARVGGTRLDTYSHEPIHGITEDLPFKLKSRLIQSVARDKKAQAWTKAEIDAGRDPSNGNTISPFEEYMVQRAGDIDVELIRKKDSSLWRDLRAWFKVNVSRSATPDEIGRWLSNRYTFGKEGKELARSQAGPAVQMQQPAKQGSSNEEDKFPRGIPPYVGHETALPRDDAGGKVAKHFNPETFTAHEGVDRLNNSFIDNIDSKVAQAEKLHEEAFGKTDLNKQLELDKKIESYGRLIAARDQTHEQLLKEPYHSSGEVIPEVARQQPKEQGSTLPEGEGKPINVIYKGKQPGFKHIPDRHLWNINEKGNPDFPHGTTVTEETLREKGYKVPERPPEQYQQPEEQASTTTDPERKGWLNVLTSDFDKVGRVSTVAREALHNYGALRDKYLGLRNVAGAELGKFKDSEIAHAVSYMRDMYRDGSSAQARPRDEVLLPLKEFFTKFRDEQIKEGMTIHGREAGKNEWYVPDMLSDKAIDTFVNKTGSETDKYLRGQWVEYLEGKGMSADEATSTVNDYIGALGEKKDNYLAVNFGALRKAAGFGLPSEIRETSGMRLLDKYGRRAANDLAMYVALEKPEDVRDTLHLRNPHTGELPSSNKDMSIPQSAEVRKAMKWVLGNFEGAAHPRIASAIRVVNNALLGAPTGIRDIVSVPVNALPYIQNFSDVAAFWKGMHNWRQNAADSLRTNARNKNLDTLQWGDISNEPDRWTATANKLASALRTYQGRELLEQGSRIWTFGIGKELAVAKLAAARAGDAKAKSWLEKFGRLTDVNSAEVDLDQIAKNFVDRVQGTYDGRGLPGFTVEGSTAPFFALQKWGIEKSNVIWQDVVQPFVSGKDRMPFLTYALGSVMTGAAIQELNKLLTGRSPQDATIKETMAKLTPKNAAAELATIMQLGSYAGLVGDMAKAASDIALRGKTPRNVISFPTATFAADVATKFADASEAIKEGEAPWKVGTSLVTDILTGHIQTFRSVANHTFNKDDVTRSDKFRDLRVYKQLEGEPTSDIPTGTNKYLNPDVREFKQTSDPARAAELMPKLMAKVVEIVGAGKPEKAMAFLANLKRNSYQTMPGTDKFPQEFVGYWNYLKETQGEDVALERVRDYLTQTRLNEAKSSMVPN